MTYNVFSGTLNPTHSINQEIINQPLLHSNTAVTSLQLDWTAFDAIIQQYNIISALCAICFVHCHSTVTKT